MSIEWKPDYAIGYEKIDAQHKELFRRFNDLVVACKERRGRGEIDSLFNFLDEYVIYHFGEEEELMASRGYPQYEEHRRLHREFVERLQKWRHHLKTAGPTLDLVIETNQSMIVWLIDHICGVDIRLGQFLNNRSQ